jgi:hypothetical protein
MRVAMVESQASANAKWTPQQQLQVDQAIRQNGAHDATLYSRPSLVRTRRTFPVTKGMTARLLVAQRNGVIKNTGEITFAERGGEHDHAQRLTIWQSL